ncbi:hypothetical protein [Psychroserpens sp.]|uniref:hypothetical protein n=1 Tax=Psychroserpens sp. TaxID=2020870 RepID=UPI0038589382
MMKNFKLFLLSFALIAGFLTSCSNEDSVVEEQNINETEAITESLNRLAQQFDDEGNVILSENPSGNIVFDFGFDFVYPLNLSLSNGSTVAINSLEDLIDVLISSTDELYVNGIEFPFDVEVYDEATDSIVVITINNEDEFYDLIDSFNWEDQDTCECFEVYEPVCVEITDPNGDSFVITYPNECYAMCDGFTPNDFVDNCADDYNGSGGFECFEFNFPLTIITDDQQTITVNSQEELDNALYNAYYFDFVYPFNVTDSEGNVESVEDEQDLYELLEDCYDYNDCPCPANVIPVCVEVETPNGGTEILTFLNACEAECEGFTDADFVECEDVVDPCNCDDDFVPVCVQVEVDGQMVTYTFPNECYAICEGYTPNDFVECDDNNNPNNCSEGDLFGQLLQCQWYLNTSLYDTLVAEYAQFSQDGTVTIYSDGSGQGVTGTWELASNPSTAEVFMFLNFNDAPYDSIALLDWTVTQCSDGFIALSSGNDIVLLERDCD